MQYLISDVPLLQRFKDATLPDVGRHTDTFVIKGWLQVLRITSNN